MPSVSLYLEYGGDFVISPQGGLLLAKDTAAEATSTLQRLQRLILTCPQVVDPTTGNILARGDSIFYPKYGAGLRAFVDADMTQDMLNQIQASILDQIAQDPGISRVPAPTVSISSDGVSAFSVSVSVTTVSGQVVTTPAYPLSTSLGGNG